MATSFKVPRSPKKSIFEIDEFLGVDLTNNGTNIEENRSPNATNMVRQVPGKVRKRTGYKDKVIFSDETDINRVKSSSESYIEFKTNTTPETAFELYENFDEGDEFSFSFEYEVFGKYHIHFGGLRYGVSSSGDTAKIDKYTITSMTAIDSFSEMTINAQSGTYSEDNYLKIKKFMVFRKISGTSVADIPWSLAPEESNGVMYAHNIAKESVYGVHHVTLNDADGDEVINVNRVLGTSSNDNIFEATDTYRKIYSTADNNFYQGRYYVEFDYTSTKPITISYYFPLCVLESTSELTHVSTCFDYSDSEALNFNSFYIKATNSGETATVNIKNFSMMYAKDENYSWSPAPEDRGVTFGLDKVFSSSITVLDISYTYSDSYVPQYDSTFVTPTASDMLIPSSGCDYLRITGTFSATSPSTSSNRKISITIRRADGSYVKLYSTTSTEMSNKELDVVVPANLIPEYAPLRVGILFEYSRSLSVTYQMKNVKVTNAIMKTDFSSNLDATLYHVGNKLYASVNGRNPRKLFSDMVLQRSTSWQFGKYVYIVDGKNYLRFSPSDEIITDIPKERVGYIPTITISRNPSGTGGTSYDGLNLIQSGFTEQFLCQNSTYSGSETTRIFYLSFGKLDSTKVRAWILNSSGDWVEKEEDVDFSVNRTLGRITFTTAPGATPLRGEDNVKITAYRTVEGYAKRITNCRFGALFGVNGASDRLFLSGNPNYPNYDWYSEQYDPTYFPDQSYSVLGTETSAIMGYSIVNNYLATMKDEYEPSQSVFIREGDLITDENDNISRPSFKLINTLQGNGAIAPHSFGYLQTEPLFLTRSGIYAITAQDITGEKYSQNRSFYLNGALTEEENLENAYAVVFNDMYILAINNKLYILDGLQATRTDKSEPYATRQYVGFLCTDIPANCMWVDDQALWFGTNDGRVCKFATDVDDLESYNDNGEPIYCCWETPDLDGQLFYKNKSFRYIAIRMMSALRTSLKLWDMARGSWNFIKEDTSTGIFFDFDYVDFGDDTLTYFPFSFSTDTTDKVAHSKIRVKKVDKARFKIENGKLNEPFGLMNLALEYVERGNYKG